MGSWVGRWRRKAEGWEEEEEEEEDLAVSGVAMEGTWSQLPRKSRYQVGYGRKYGVRSMEISRQISEKAESSFNKNRRMYLRSW